MSAAPVRRNYVEGRWGQVHLRIAGEPDAPSPTLLLLHPTPKSGWIYERLMPRLAVARRVIAPDTPGYGASDPPPAPAAVEDLAGEMLALADGPIDVLGYHTGSVIAVAMARAAPRRVRRLVLTSLPLYPADERVAKRARLAHWPGPAADGSHLAAAWALVQRLSDPRTSLAWRQASLAENLRCGDRAPWGYDAVYRYDLAAALPLLSQPVLVLNPEDDLHAQTRAAIGLLPQAQLLDLPNVGHGLFDLEADRIGAAVLAFLDGADPTGG